MERTHEEEEEEIALRWGEFPSDASENHLFNLRQHLLRHTNTQEPTTPNPTFLGTLPDQFLETAFTRLNLSTPSDQSPFLSSAPPPSPVGVFGGPIRQNSLSNLPDGRLFSPLSSQQMLDRELQRLRTQNAIMASYMRTNGIAPTVGAESLDGFGLPLLNSTAVNSDPNWQFCNGGGVTGTNVCRSSCCNYHISSDCCLQHPELLRQELSNNFSIRPSSYRNGFQFDSGYSRGGSEYGGVSELVNSNILRSLSYDQHLNHMQQNSNYRLQQHRNYSSLEDLRGLRYRQQHSKYPNYVSLENLQGRILLVAKDQHGCRYLQKKLEEKKAEEIEMIFLEVKDHVCELMVDRFANYLVQKLVAVCNEDQNTELLLSVIRDESVMITVCTDTHGTRAVQHLLTNLSTPQQKSRLMSVLRRHVIVLTKDINGHHVIEHCLKNFSYGDTSSMVAWKPLYSYTSVKEISIRRAQMKENLQGMQLKMHLLNAIADHCVEIGTSRSGCCVLQLCVNRAQGETRERLVAEITTNALILSEDPFGFVLVNLTHALLPLCADNIFSWIFNMNLICFSIIIFFPSSNYVVQYMLELQIPHITEDLLRQLEGNFISLSMNKFGSNVVEKFLKESGEQQTTRIIKELLSCFDILMLLQHEYGNYVMQSALTESKGPIYNTLVDVVRRHLQALRSHPNGKRVLDKINMKL
ncbi:hypothetical protein HHK36_002679 [Tetracentron sinense]|uniref:PUM-HD domain-containing protein n=1 Tax=Tetracentron sinense TaxID=13715 RepID=A0A834ZPV8_TETSI|nr:hypothetical protein HHK36_002679 [Tetracentron sinense]